MQRIKKGNEEARSGVEIPLATASIIDNVGTTTTVLILKMV